MGAIDSAICLQSAIQPLISTSANSSKTDVMEGATDYEDESSLKNPVNQVLAVLDPGVDTKAVIQSLNEAGFPEDSIGILGGRKDADKLDKASESMDGWPSWRKLGRALAIWTHIT